MNPFEHMDSMRLTMQHFLMNNILVNASHWCYASSGFLSTIWALLSCRGFDCCQLSIGDDSLCPMIRDAATHPLSLADQPWFRSMMVHWTGGIGEADAAEFVHLLLSALRLPDLNFGWKKFIEVDGSPPELFDHGGPIQPILLQIPTCPPQELTIDQLIHHWATDGGMQTALQHPADVICFQVDRFAQTENTKVIKLETLVQYDGPILVPVIQGHMPHVTHLKYDVIAATLHRGCPERGHYQALLRVTETRQNSAGHDELPEAARPHWLLTDDGVPTKLLLDWPTRIAQQVSLLWLVKQQLISVPDAPPPIQVENSRDRLLNLLTR